MVWRSRIGEESDPVMNVCEVPPSDPVAADCSGCLDAVRIMNESHATHGARAAIRYSVEIGLYFVSELA